MCGIVALWDETLTATETAVLAGRMAGKLAHRGPDASGTWWHESRGIALAHRRLAVRGLGQQGAQPMRSDQDGVLVFNGELFGVESLRTRLLREGRVFRGSSDTEVLLHAIVALGFEGALESIRGQFALAWFDSRARRLHVARDPMGIRPLYYAEGRGRLAVGSEQKALLGLPWVGTEPNRLGMLRFLLLGRTDDVPGETLLTSVRSLPAGHHGSFDGTTLDVRRYRRVQVQVPSSGIADLRREIERAVGEQLVSDVALGCMVSGGLDSSAVVCVADTHRARTDVAEPMHLFAYHDELAEQDESEYQRAVLASIKGPHRVHWVSSRPGELADNWSRYVHHQEEPYGDASSYAEYCIARAAAREGVKVLLSGLGGDEVFLGYPAFYGPLVLDLVQHGELKALMALLRASPAVLGRRAGSWTLPARAAVYHALPARLRNLMTAMRTGPVAGLGASDTLRGATDAFLRWHDHDGSPRTNAALRGAIESWSVPRFLTHSDRMCLAHGVEGRVPLLDEQLVTTALGIPLAARTGTTGLKAALRLALQDVLPPMVRDRAWKLGFHAPLKAYVTALEEPLRQGLARVRSVLGEAPSWSSLPPELRWRWGNLGAYLGWVETMQEPFGQAASS